VSASAAPDARSADPAAIERELAELWRIEAELVKQLGEGEGPLARVLLLTMAVLSPSPALAEAARQVAIAINPRQPARVIIMEVLAGSAQAAPGGAAPPLDAWATLHCSKANGGHQQVCGEQITLEASPEAVRSLPGAVLPLLLTNVPSFLWWQSGSPFGHPVLKELAPAIDRLIVDSYTFAEPEPELAQMAAAVADPSFHAVISDLSWARLGPWRYQTAQIFDAPALRPYLNRLAQVTVTFCDGTPVLAWLFAGWLASRLGWQPVRREAGPAGPVVHFAGGQRLSLEATPPLAPGMGGYFSGVMLAADDGATFQVTRLTPRSFQARVVAGAFASERVRPLPEETHVQWVGHELAQVARGPIYESVLALLASVFKLG
jgi:glucose-6-phosphate dehydrogenase assembly protein OpcA